MAKPEPAAAPTMVLHDTLDLTQAGELAKAFGAARGTDLTVDASRVGRVGTQCVQVLLSAKAAWDADGATFSVTDPSDAFAEALRLLGLHSAFAIEEPCL